jgi:hypothetical protein
MKKPAKPKSNRTQIKDLTIEQQELATDEARKVKGGAGWEKIQEIKTGNVTSARNPIGPTSIGCQTMNPHRY